MKKFGSFGYIPFLLTYVCLFGFLYSGVVGGYTFCLSPQNPANALGIAAGVFGLWSLIVYARHDRRRMRALGIITFILGVSIALVVVLRFVLQLSCVA